MSKQANLPGGIVAGVIGGVVASWVMNEFMEGPGKELQHAVQSQQQSRQEQDDGGQPKEDATMKAADAIVSAVTGGKRLSWDEKQKGGPIVHYAFGALMGGVYGGLAESSNVATAGFGTAFGALLFAGADLIAVPAFDLSPSAAGQPLSTLASPLAAHLVYGATTELVRRLVRSAF